MLKGRRLKLTGAAQLIAVILFVDVVAGHATAADAPLRVSLPEAVRRAERAAPEVLVAGARVEEARATAVDAGLRLPSNPRLNLDGRLGARGPERGTFGFASSLEALFDVSPAPAARREEAARRTDGAEAETRLARLTARSLVSEAYVGVRLAVLRIEQSGRALELAERLVTAAAERAQAGAGTDIEQTSAEVERAERRAELAEAEAVRLRHESELRRLIDLDAHTAIELTTSIVVPGPLPSVDELLRGAEGRFPQLVASDAQLAVLRAAEQRLQFEAWPKLGAVVGVDSSPASPAFGIVGLSVELPFAQRNQRALAIVRAERRTEEARRSALARRLDAALQGAVAVHGTRLRQLAALRDEALPAATRRVALVELGWRAGRFDVFRVTAAAQDLVRLQSKHAAILGRIWQARLLVEQLTGGLHDVEPQ